jgi:hypothetical protein
MYDRADGTSYINFASVKIVILTKMNHKNTIADNNFYRDYKSLSEVWFENNYLH